MATMRLPSLLLRVFVFLVVPLLLVHLFVLQTYYNPTTHALDFATTASVSENASTHGHTNTTSFTTTTTTKKNPIFYNLYLPRELPEKARIFGNDWSQWDTPTKRRHFSNHLRRILKEQIQEWQQTAPSHTLLYVQMGDEDINKRITQALHQQSKNRNGKSSLDCHRLQYLPVGNEVDTLQQLYEYCQDHPNEVVAYIHDKGSFHASYNNEKQRRVGTKAALECLSAMTAASSSSLDRALPRNQEQQQPPLQCHVCAGHFQVSPQFLALSNMWSAHCQYVKQLIPPKFLEATLSTLYQQILNDPHYACLAPQSTAGNHLGRGRYAMERWIWTHPILEPCNSLPRPMPQISGEFPQTNTSTSWTPRVHRAPDKTVGFYLKHEKNNFARLEGRLLEYQYLYGQLPTENSWIWKYYSANFRQGNEAFLNTCLAQPGACTMLPVNDSRSHPLCNITKGEWVV
jgi:hypothetical protein